MGLFARYVWAPVLDLVMRQEPITQQRQKVVPQATGRVLEIGVGSGLNLAWYDRERVTKVWGIDPVVELQTRSRERAAASGLDVEILTGSAERLPFDAGSFDTVVTTFTLCSIPEPGAALAEMRRVLRPGGRLLFAEHGLASDPGVARWQNRLNRPWRAFSGGCNMNRPIVPLIRDGGFAIERVDTGYVPGPRLLGYQYWGTAVPA